MKKQIAFFGSANLIQMLQEQQWKPYYGNENFPAISLGGYCLTRPQDKISPLKVKVTVIKAATGESFSQEGFCSPDVFQALELGPPIWGTNEILGRLLVAKPSNENPHAYTLEVNA